MCRSDQIWRASDADGGGVRVSDHGQAAFGWNSLAVKDLRHDCAAEHLVEIRQTGGVALAIIAGRYWTTGFLSTGTQYCRASATARDVKCQAIAFYVAIPDTATVAGRLALSVAMLSLQLACRHVGV